jgi:hypothetical protein
LIEAAMVIPVVVLIAMGVTEIGVALRNQVLVSALAREGSNLISRDVSLDQAAAALRTMGTGPIDLDSDTTIIFSVIKRGASEDTANYDTLVLYQRLEFGDGPGRSRLRTRGTGVFGDGPEYEAENSDDDINLQITNAPDGIVTSIGGLVYVTEVITVHNPFTSLSNFGVTLPTELYSIAYF